MQRSLLEVRRRLVDLMRGDPPFKLVRSGPGAVVLDRWMATRLTPDDLHVLHRLEELHGERALAEFFAEALFESGVVRPSGATESHPQ
jgi:hypothetical protein